MNESVTHAVLINGTQEMVIIPVVTCSGVYVSLIGFINLKDLLPQVLINWERKTTQQQASCFRFQGQSSSSYFTSLNNLRIKIKCQNFSLGPAKVTQKRKLHTEIPTGQTGESGDLLPVRLQLYSLPHLATCFYKCHLSISVSKTTISGSCSLFGWDISRNMKIEDLVQRRQRSWRRWMDVQRQAWTMKVCFLCFFGSKQEERHKRWSRLFPW